MSEMTAQPAGGSAAGPHDWDAPYRAAYVQITGLLKEYAAKLTDATKRGSEIQARWYGVMTGQRGKLAGALNYVQAISDEYELLRRFVSETRRPLEDLARQGSQLLEGGAITHPDKLELSLRLAEFESAFEAVMELLTHNLTNA